MNAFRPLLAALPFLLLAATPARAQQVDIDHNSLPSLGSEGNPVPAGQFGTIRNFGSVMVNLHNAAEGRARVAGTFHAVLAPGVALQLVLTEPGFSPDANSSVGAEILASTVGSGSRTAIASATIAIPGPGLTSVSPSMQVSLSANTDPDQQAIRFEVINREGVPLSVQLHLDGACDGTTFDPVLQYSVAPAAPLAPALPATPPAGPAVLPGSDKPVPAPASPS
jgi:hypothetical protein